jgi:hypothetical protein
MPIDHAQSPSPKSDWALQPGSEPVPKGLASARHQAPDYRISKRYILNFRPTV